MYWQFARAFIYKPGEVTPDGNPVISMAIPKGINIIIKGLVLYIFLLIFNFALKEMMRLNRWQTAFGVVMFGFLLFLYFLQIIHNVYDYVNPMVVRVTMFLMLISYVAIGVVLSSKPSAIFGKIDKNYVQNIEDRLSKLRSQSLAREKEGSQWIDKTRSAIMQNVIGGQERGEDLRGNTFTAVNRLYSGMGVVQNEYDMAKAEMNSAEKGAETGKTGFNILSKGTYNAVNRLFGFIEDSKNKLDK